MFSSRLPATLAPNASAEPWRRCAQSGVSLLDLTETNPTVVGLPYPRDVLAPLVGSARARYAPDPRGLAEARAAVAAEYARAARDRARSHRADGEHQRSLRALFKLLCNPGDDVLVPQPSYPLFELLTRLEGVAAQPYRLEYHGVWSIDRESLERRDDAARARHARRQPEQSDRIDAPARPIASGSWALRATRAARSSPTKCSPTIRWRRAPTPSSMLPASRAR